jgi:hypothetical protein
MLMWLNPNQNDTYIYYNIGSSHKSFIQSLTQNNNIKSWKKKYEHKVSPTTPYVLESKNESIIPIHL